MDKLLETFKQADGFRNSDPGLFTSLYNKHFLGIYRFANSYLHDADIARNIVHDAFLTLWENMDKLKESTNIPAYLLTIVKNNSLNHLNRQKIRLRVEEQVQSNYLNSLELRCSTLEACNPEQLFSSDIESIIRSTLSQLPDRCRKAFILSRFNGLSNLEISLKMDITQKGVEFHITKALKLLRTNLKDYLISVFIGYLLFF